MQTHAKNKSIRALAPNVDGKAILVMRYICAQEPPQDLDSIYKVVRFVSMIPFVSDSLAFDRKEVWSDSQTFLSTLAGDYEEHAILLCNYMKHLKKNSFVVLGFAFPEGNTAYVLTIEGDKSHLLWQPGTGQCFTIMDSRIPLHSITQVFNDENVLFEI